MVTLSIPIELEQNWITLSWAAESVVLIWIGFRIASVRIRQAAFAVLVLCLFRLFAWDAFEPLSRYTLVFNRRVFSFLAAIAAVYLMAMFYRRNLFEHGTLGATSAHRADSAGEWGHCFSHHPGVVGVP